MNGRRAFESICILAILVATLAGCGRQEKPEASATPLICHVGGTMRPVMEELAKAYQQRTGQAVEINSAGSGELLAHIELQKSGDVYVCHDPFGDVLMAKGLGVDGWTVAGLVPVIVVQKGNPKNIRGLADLARDDVEVILTDYQRSTLGRMLPTIFAKAGIDLAELDRRKAIETNKSGGYVANKVKMRNADAAIVWNAVGHLRLDGVDIVPITGEHLPTPGIDTVTAATGPQYLLTPVRVTAATLTCSTRPAAAAAFAEFVTGDEAHEVFRQFGFRVIPVRREYAKGKRNTPTVRMYAGAGLRRGVEKLIEQFQARTAIQVEPDYGGSGVLLGRVIADPKADLFLPGDRWYVEQLREKADLVQWTAPAAWFVPVIITAKGNPKNITSLADLFGEDVAVAVGNPKACQIGRVTAEILAAAGLDAADLPDDTRQSLTVNELGVWVKMGQADAAIVWDAIAANLADEVDVVTIPPRHNRTSRVVTAVLRTSTERLAAERFAHFVAGEEGRAVLREAGFRTDPPEGN